MLRREFLKSTVAVSLFGKALISQGPTPDIRSALLWKDPRKCLGYLLNHKGQVYQPSSVIEYSFFKDRYSLGFSLLFYHPIHQQAILMGLVLRHPELVGEHLFNFASPFCMNEGDTFNCTASISYTFNEYKGREPCWNTKDSRPSGRVPQLLSAS